MIIMRITRTGKPDNFYYYIIEDYRDENGRKKTRTVESLGCARVIREKYNVPDAEAWCKNYVAQKNEELQNSKINNKRVLTIKLREDLPKNSSSSIFNVGYLILEKLYYSFGIANICDEIMNNHPHINGFDLNDVLKTMLFGRILYPSSKAALVSDYQYRLLENSKIELQHVYRAMDLLHENSNLIQNRLYQYSSQECCRDVSRLYYDCTNFYTEKELEDCDRTHMSDEWHSEHTLRKYGKSKENRPNPVVQMGLFMDGDGMPLGFCINPGCTNEQKTMIPLEEKIIKNFNTEDIIVCTDCGLSGDDNRKFNNVDSDDILVKGGFKGQRHFICTQSLKKLKDFLKKWALEPSDWSFCRRRPDGHSETVTGFNLEDLCNSDDLYSEYYNTVFFKERTTSENGLDSRLIVTFSLKYMDYMRSLRERKINRALKMIDSGRCYIENERSPRALIKKTYATDNGEVARHKAASIDTDKIASDEMFDGFYAVATNLFDLQIGEIIKINSRRWEIEECFRIMKTDLEARPFYHSKDQRIISHFMTCFMALLLIRGIERKISERNSNKIKYPESKYTITQILKTLKDLRVIALDGGAGYQLDYNNSQLVTDLLDCFDLKEFEHMVVMKDSMKKILKNIKKSPKMIKTQK